VDLIRHVLQPVVGLGDASGGESVGRDDVRTGRQISVVDGANHVRTSQTQEVVVAPDVARVVAETLSTEIGLGQAVALNQRAGGPVEHENPPL